MIVLPSTKNDAATYDEVCHMATVYFYRQSAEKNRQQHGVVFLITINIQKLCPQQNKKT